MKKYLGLFMGLALFLPMAAGAAEFRQGDNVNFSETIRDNVYAAGGTVTIAGTIDGDLYVGGGTITIMGTVTKDVIVGGGTVIITGRVGDDLRVGGGNITIGGSVGGELLAGGGSVSVLPGAMIGKSAFIGGGNTNMAGSVSGNLKIGGDSIILGPEARVAGNFDYYSSKEATINSSAKINGATSFHKQAVKAMSRVNKFPFFAFLTIWWLLGIVGMTIFACILFYAWRGDSDNIISTAFAKPGRELLRGFILFFIIPIAAIALMITMLGLPIGFTLIFLYAALLMAGAVVSGLLAAGLLAKFIFNKKETDINWWMIFLAVVLLSIVKLIPFIGWILSGLIYLVAIGVLGNKIYSKIAPER
ncbi:MAG: hypothetical protein PHT44_04630 [Candidatus Portnoybacteria bacterium]|nr:hypothetical protein [Candidatus Portnoybacteria bacterium]MDD4983203.1 hypothetical protein [Candidatus Portnoybacteria bacterium]